MKLLINSSKNINFYKLYYDNNKENIPLNNNIYNDNSKNKLLNSKELKKNFGKNISNHLTTLINNNNNNFKNYSLIIKNKNNILKINNFNSKNINNNLNIKDKNINKNLENKKTNSKNSLNLIFNDNNNNNNYNSINKKEPKDKNELIINDFPEKEYFFDFFEYILSIESDFLPKLDYMNLIQNDINENMRNILLEWLFELHNKFQLHQETFLLTINIIDRYLSIKKINRNYLQLLGITAMLISCKFEEIYTPKINDFIYYTDYTYNVNEVINMEFEILNTLDFNINFASSLSFLNMYKYLYLKIDENMNSFCNFLINLAAVDYKMIKFKSSHIAISIIFISYLQFNKNINEFYLNNNKFKLKNEIIESIKNIIKSWIKIDDNKFQVIKRKYMSDKYYKIGKEKIDFDLNYLL
jgi:hypothetical protein